jgi:hypothetical protein
MHAQVRRSITVEMAAPGVEISMGPSITADREVILSSARSGRLVVATFWIGPADELKALGIDAVSSGVGLTCRITWTSMRFVRLPARITMTALPSCIHQFAGSKYLLTRKGPVASSPFETVAFGMLDEKCTLPDIQHTRGLGTGIEAGAGHAVA